MTLLTHFAARKTDGREIIIGSHSPQRLGGNRSDDGFCTLFSSTACASRLGLPIVKTGRSKYLTKQAGEYLVAAELSRRGYIATTFTGNVPYYDIIAVDDRGGHVVVQVRQ